MRKKIFALLSLFMVVSLASMALAACAPAAPGTIVETVEVVKTQIVEIAGTPMVITATPEPEPSGEPLKVVSPEFKNPDTYMVIGGAGEPETLDPAWTYETAGGGTEANIYEGLVWYDRQNYDKFIPALATEWTTSPDGLEWTFKIRKGVTFHEGGTLEPHDVAYSLIRHMLQGRVDGPQWIAYEGFFGSALAMSSIKNFAAAYIGKESFEELTPEDLKKVCEDIKSKIIVDDAAGTVTYKLAQPMPWMLPVVANNYMGHVLDQEWMIEQGDWDGTCDNWTRWADPPAEGSLLFNKANGTGPYKLDHWTPGEEIVLVANENYWRTEPMWEGGPSGAPQIKRVVIKNITEWGTRMAMFEAGDADWIYAPPQYRPQLYPYAKEYCTADGSSCQEADPQGYIRVYKDLPEPAITPAQFNWQINTEGGNPYIGSGQLDGNGTPPDFFQDIHIRYAFNYCFNFQAMIDDSLAGEGMQAQGPIIKGMMGYREGEAPLFSYDPAKCEEEFKLADADHDGIPAGEDEDDVWNLGFYMQIGYNAGNDTRKLSSEILKAGLEAVNPNFSVQVLSMPWPILLESRRQGKLPVYVGGWQEDFHDPHNWVQPFLFSDGNYGRVINMTDDYKQKYDKWILEGIKETDPEKRRAIYEQIQLAAQEDAVVIWMYQRINMAPLQLWMKGFYYNPAYSQEAYSWIYALSKEAQ
jgi:peptide/nickel transport system substrate-binding protein